MDELDRNLQWRLNIPEYAGMSLDAVVETLRTTRNTLVGTPDMIVEQIQALREAGVEEIMLQWWNMDDVASLHIFAEEVLPYV